MSTFEVKAHKLVIEDHPNADTLELAKIGEYKSIVRKGDFKTGDLAIYIPEASVLPLSLLQEMGLEGKLAGSGHDRVKCVRLRGEISQGLVYPISDDMYKHFFDTYGMGRGQEKILEIDWAEYLGITKYEPPIPTQMEGEVYNFGMNIPKFDIENYKMYPDVLLKDEIVVLTEKLHGINCVLGLLPYSSRKEEHWKGRFVVGSKGLSQKGLVFQNNDNNSGNLYVNAVKQLRLDDKMFEVFGAIADSENKPIWVRGEIFGQGVQDLKYGFSKPQFRIFNMEMGWAGDSEWLNYHAIQEFAKQLGVPMVPLLYMGPWDKSLIDIHTKGLETVSGHGANIREGFVVTPIIPRRDPRIGNVILKSVSEDYLMRKGDVTELQ